MNPPLVGRYFEARLRALRALAEAVVHPHNGLAGSAREILVRDFLNAHIPSGVAIGSGLVFGYNWARREAPSDISRQQDIVIHRRDMPLLIVAESPLYFRESVVATIEVKTNYEPGKLHEVLENARSVLRIQPAPTVTLQMGSSGSATRVTPRRVLCGVFYFRGPGQRTPLVAKLNELLRLQALGGDAVSATPGPDFVFSAEAGLIVRDKQFNTLFGDGVEVEGRDAIHGGLSVDEQRDGAYRRVFGDDEKWRGLQALVLEVADRCQRYALSYSDLSKYA